VYAIIEVGAKQYYVKKDDTIDVEKQAIEEGKVITLDKVLLVSKDKKLEVGTPYLNGASVSGVVLKHLRGEKSVAFKYRRRKASHWKKGHRQALTRIKIKDIILS